MKKKKYITLSLDEINQSDYFYTDYDVGGEGHYITIRAENKAKFLDAWAAEWRRRASELLEKREDNDFEEL